MPSKTFRTDRAYEPNEVDALIARINEIQRTCKHSYANKKGLTLWESDRTGVYVVGSQGRTTNFTLTCTHCNHEKIVSAAEICPECVEPMSPYGPALPAKLYNPNWGKGFWGAREEICVNCRLRVVYEFFDR